jgi:hypothetical protein
MTLKAIHEVYAAWTEIEQGWTASKQKLAEELRSHGYESFLSLGVTKFKIIRARNLRAEDEAARAKDEARRKLQLWEYHFRDPWSRVTSRADH